MVIEPATSTVWASMRLQRRVGQIELVFDLADDLLQHVLQRDDAGRRAVLVDNDRKLLALLTQLAQQRADILGFGDDERGAGEVGDGR